MTHCTAALPSLTYAMKAQRALESEGIPSLIVKLDSSLTRRGCAYGLEFSCDRQRAVRRTLAAAHISVRQYLDGGGGEML